MVTKRGKPQAALVKLTEDDIDDIVLTQPNFIEEIGAAKQEYEEEGAALTQICGQMMSVIQRGQPPHGKGAKLGKNQAVNRGQINFKTMDLSEIKTERGADHDRNRQRVADHNNRSSQLVWVVLSKPVKNRPGALLDGS